jgi:hypothetical protein
MSEPNKPDDLEQEIDQFFELIGKLAGLQDHKQNTEPSADKPTTEPAGDGFIVRELSEEMIANLLVSPLPIERAKGRLLATGVIETLRQFINHEKERNTSVGTVMMALTEMSAMIIGSVVAQSAKDRLASDKLIDAITSEFLRLLRTIVGLGWQKARRGRP